MSVTVEEGFSGYVVLDVSTGVGFVAGQHTETITMQSGDSVRIKREDDGEKGEIRIVLNRDKEYSTIISAYESYELTVTADGEIEEEITVA